MTADVKGHALPGFFVSLQISGPDDIISKTSILI